MSSTPTTEDQLRKQLTDTREECATLASALHTVLSESEDPESVRTCVAALLGTSTGRHYLDLHPLRY
jgi:hypothetical protein